MTAALAYIEPGVLTILKLSSFLLVFNVLNSILDNAIYCGLLGQIMVGVAWGTPGGKLLDVDLETAIVQFGYLGLILLVYEGAKSHSTYTKMYSKELKYEYQEVSPHPSQLPKPTSLCRLASQLRAYAYPSLSRSRCSSLPMRHLCKLSRLVRRSALRR